ncbi:MAG: DUF6952 family protein [Flavicella sp.]
MRLPVIKHIHNFIEDKDADYVEETIALLEHLCESTDIKDEELDVIGELLSNMYGALEVDKSVKAGETQKKALNAFMKRVLGSIDT